MRKGPDSDGTARRVPKGRRLEKRRRKCQEGNNGIRKPDPTDQPCLRMGRTSGGGFRKPTILAMGNPVVGSTTGVYDVNYWTF
jgi:hypothetical protein